MGSDCRGWSGHGGSGTDRGRHGHELEQRSSTRSSVEVPLEVALGSLAKLMKAGMAMGATALSKTRKLPPAVHLHQGQTAVLGGCHGPLDIIDGFRGAAR